MTYDNATNYSKSLDEEILYRNIIEISIETTSKPIQVILRGPDHQLKVDMRIINV